VGDRGDGLIGLVVLGVNSPGVAAMQWVAQVEAVGAVEGFLMDPSGIVQAVTLRE